MTYCVAMRLNTGMVFLSDSRTNAGLDQISTFRKMTVYEVPGERAMVLLSSGNLAATQAIRQVLRTHTIAGAEGSDSAVSLWNATNMFDAARVLGSAVRQVYDRDAESLKKFSIDFNVNLIFGGQIQGEPMRLFNVYAAGNFVEATSDSVCYFQVGESKYGKPIIDRVVTPATPLDEAAKCALISMDSTLKSNLSVGLPLDLLVYEADSLKVSKFVCIGENNPYFRMIHTTWGQKLRQVFEDIPDPLWNGDTPAAGSHGTADFPLRTPAPQPNPLKKIVPPEPPHKPKH